MAAFTGLSPIPITFCKIGTARDIGTADTRCFVRWNHLLTIYNATNMKSTTFKTFLFLSAPLLSQAFLRGVDNPAMPDSCRRCDGAAACDGLSEQEIESKIACGSCDGKGVCTNLDQTCSPGLSSSFIDSDSCHNKDACAYSCDLQVDKQACWGFQACYNSTSIDVGEGSCHGQSSCAWVLETTVGENSCSGYMSLCQEVETSVIGDNSCNDGVTVCWRMKDVTIGDNSCSGTQACQELENIKIGDNSCNCNSCCMEATEDIPDNTCNYMCDPTCPYNPYWEMQGFCNATSTGN